MEREKDRRGLSLSLVPCLTHTWHVHAHEEDSCRKQPITLPPSNSSMIPSASATPRRSPRRSRAVSRRRRRRNAASARTPLVGCSATARALAAGLWRLHHAERQAASPAARWHHGPPSPRHGRKANVSKTRSDFGVGGQCRNHGILEKIEACVELPYGSMERATKWDHVYVNNLDDIFGSHDPCKLPHVRYAHATVVLEAELGKARAQVSELEDERRVMRKKLERFLRKLSEEKALWKSRMREKARYAIAALKEDARMERKHRRELEAANTKLMNELAETKLSAKQFVQSYEMERKARELMEEACDELTREVEEDRAEVELLRRECLSMREEMEEERRMLQMAEVWREERVQMKLSDAKVALEHRYSQLNRLQAEMESFLRKDGKTDANNSALLQEARMISGAASSVRFRNVKEFSHQNPHSREDVDLVFEHFGRKDGSRYSPASPASDIHSVSPATDIFLEKLDETYANGSAADTDNSSGWETPHRNGRRDSCAWVATSDPSVARASNASSSLPNGKGGWDGGAGGGEEAHSGAGRRSGKNTALIRRLWRSAISESRKRAGSGTDGWTPSSDRRSTLVTPVAEQCSSSDSVKLLQRSREPKGCDASSSPRPAVHKQSLKEKLMEARMDDEKLRAALPCTETEDMTAENLGRTMPLQLGGLDRSTLLASNPR